MKIIILALMTLLVGCSSQMPSPTETPVPTNTPISTPTEIYCDFEQYSVFVGALDELWKKWMDQLEVAEATPKFSLPDQIVRLQEIKREFEKLKPSDCTIKLYSLLMNSSKNTIDAYLAFLSDDPYEELINEALTQIEEMTNELNRLNSCMPKCKP